jgi:site-specific DNA-methyltransferase (adenine-specific)
VPLQPYFENDGIVLYHGDCREVLPELPPEMFDLALTDPPYLVSYTGRWDKDLQEIQGDSDPNWIEPAFREVWRVLKCDALCLSFYGWPSADIFLGTWKGIGFRPVSLLALFKLRWGFGHFTRAQHETAYLLAKGHPEKPARAIGDVLYWDQVNPLLHPNQKPLGAIANLMATFTNATASVLDPFCGSGTTLVAARTLGRRAVGIEIDERFCEVAARRLSQQVLDFTDPIEVPEQLMIIDRS